MQPESYGDVGPTHAAGPGPGLELAPELEPELGEQRAG